MADLLPSTPDIDRNDEPRVVGLDSEDADEFIDALSSATTREVLAALHEDPASPSELADRVDTSLQNVQYHLGKLEDSGLIEVGDTVYSEKGREMNVYVPADGALVVVAGREEETTGLKAALSRLLGGVGILGIASVVVDRLARRGLTVGFGATGGAAGGDGGGGDGGGAGGAAPTPESDADGGAAAGDAATATPTPEPTPTETASETAAEGSVQIAEATTTTAGPSGTPTATPVETATATPMETATATPMETATPTPMGTATPVPEATTTPTPTVAATETTTVADLTAEPLGTTTAAAAQPGALEGVLASPGLLFFLGGVTVLVSLFALRLVGR